MTVDVYERLAEVLDHLPNGFPRSSTGVEIAILQKIFSFDEAWLANLLTGEIELVELIAERADLPVEETGRRLQNMAKRGLVWSGRSAEQPGFRLAPFIVGIYEAQIEQMDSELAHLFEHYLAEGGALGLMTLQPAFHRVLPAQGTAKTEWILPYDDVRQILESAQTFVLSDCICRVQQDQASRRQCEFPVRSCLSFSSRTRDPGPLDVSKEEALAALEHFEEMGLVHCVSNVATGVGYVCNCCGCCCGILRGINDFGILGSVAHTNYLATTNPDLCIDCGICIGRCQVHAISQEEARVAVDVERCIGCGLCVSGCPQQAMKLQLKPEAERIHPPQDYAEWERQRLVNRGLSG